MKTSKNSTSTQSDEEKKAKRREYNRRYREKNPHRHRERHIKNRYGITYAQRDEMLAAQGGACDICGANNPQKGGQDWVVDHCHETGKVRGILCHPCNVALGLFRDNSHTLAQAIHYLGKHNG